MCVAVMCSLMCLLIFHPQKWQENVCVALNIPIIRAGLVEQNVLSVGSTSVLAVLQLSAP